MCSKTSILLLRLCYILICNKKEADVINCYVAIQDFMKAQVSRLVETCAVTVFRKLKVGPLNGILTTKAGSPSHLPPQQFSSFSKIVFNFSFESKITKNTLLPAYTQQHLRLVEISSTNIQALLCKIVIEKIVFETSDDTHRRVYFP